MYADHVVVESQESTRGDQSAWEGSEDSLESSWAKGCWKRDVTPYREIMSCVLVSRVSNGGVNISTLLFSIDSHIPCQLRPTSLVPALCNEPLTCTE